MQRCGWTGSNSYAVISGVDRHVTRCCTPQCCRNKREYEGTEWMIGSARGCLRIFIVIGVLAILGFLWFTQGNELRSLWNELTGRPPEEQVMPSQALADHAQT